MSSSSLTDPFDLCGAPPIFRCLLDHDLGDEMDPLFDVYGRRTGVRPQVGRTQRKVN